MFGAPYTPSHIFCNSHSRPSPLWYYLPTTGHLSSSKYYPPLSTRHHTIQHNLQYTEMAVQDRQHVYTLRVVTCLELLTPPHIYSAIHIVGPPLCGTIFLQQAIHLLLNITLLSAQDTTQYNTIYNTLHWLCRTGSMCIPSGWLYVWSSFHPLTYVM